MNGMCVRMTIWVCDSSGTIIKSSCYQIFFNWVIAYRLGSALGRFSLSLTHTEHNHSVRLTAFRWVIFHLSLAHPGRTFFLCPVAALCYNACVFVCTLHYFRLIFSLPLNAGHGMRYTCSHTLLFLFLSRLRLIRFARNSLQFITLLRPIFHCWLSKVDWISSACSRYEQKTPFHFDWLVCVRALVAGIKRQWKMLPRGLRCHSVCFIKYFAH